MPTAYEQHLKHIPGPVPAEVQRCMPLGPTVSRDLHRVQELRPIPTELEEPSHARDHSNLVFPACVDAPRKKSDEQTRRSCRAPVPS